jgi:4-amino-4-deoxy-L-arabinose transferase-like glycosyltransferase
LPVLVGGFFPWSCFLPLAVFRIFRDRLIKRDEAAAFLLSWFLVIFLFFTVASSKLATYLLPAFPALSCLVGLLWRDLIEDRAPGLQRGVLYSFFVLVGVFAAAMIYLFLNPPQKFEPDYGLNLSEFKYEGLVFLAALAVPVGLWIRGKRKASFMALTAAIVCAFLFALMVVVPMLNPYRSTKRFALKLDRMLPPGEKLVFGRVLRDSTLFYTNRRAVLLTTRKELINFLGSDERVYCVIRRSLIEQDERLRQIAHIIDREGHKVIISNRR